MWLALMLMLTVAFVLVAGILAGGIFTIVLVPLAALGLVALLATSLAARVGGVPVTRSDRDTDASQRVIGGDGQPGRGPQAASRG